MSSSLLPRLLGFVLKVLVPVAVLWFLLNFVCAPSCGKFGCSYVPYCASAPRTAGRCLDPLPEVHSIVDQGLPSVTDDPDARRGKPGSDHARTRRNRARLLGAVGGPRARPRRH